MGTSIGQLHSQFSKDTLLRDLWKQQVLYFLSFPFLKLAAWAHMIIFTPFNHCTEASVVENDTLLEMSEDVTLLNPLLEGAQTL